METSGKSWVYDGTRDAGGRLGAARGEQGGWLGALKQSYSRVITTSATRQAQSMGLTLKYQLSGSTRVIGMAWNSDIRSILNRRLFVFSTSKQFSMRIRSSKRRVDIRDYWL